MSESIPESVPAKQSSRLRRRLPGRSGDRKQSLGLGQPELGLGHAGRWLLLCSVAQTSNSLIFSSSLSRLGLILLLLQYSTELLFHMARLFYFADENNEKL